ncbi:MAG: hypothetical protein EAZ81_08250 [Verrucomicrobia bacterium]|nr:MAG: hypothetical protein EAZ81_08250 [Verrucomicrobiota bacterium]
MKLSLSFLAVLGVSCWADDLDFGVAKLQWHSYDNHDSERGATDLQFDQWRLQSPLHQPLSLTKDWYLLSGARYEQIHLDGPSATGAAFEEDLHLLELPMVLLYRPEGSDWSYNARISPGLSSDLDSITTDDMFVDARLGGNYRWNEKNLGFVYQANDQLRLQWRGFTVEARYRVMPSWVLRFTGEVVGGYWNIDTPDSDYLALQSYRMGLTLERELAEDLWLVAGAGITMANELRWQDNANDTIRRDEFDGGSYFTLGLRLRDW